MKYIHLLVVGFLIITTSAFGQRVEIKNVDIHFESSEPQVKYAVDRLGLSIFELEKDLNSDASFTLIVDTTSLAKEAFSIEKAGTDFTIYGGDGTGILYGVLSVIEDLNNGLSLNQIKPKKETPELQFRAIKFDMPWDTYRHSTALSLHQEVCSTPEYWEAFLDMMAENRFNVLTLWNLHPFTFLIKPTNFPEASPWTDEEMAEWKRLFTQIFDMAEERGIDTYIMPFNIFVTPEFARAHNVAMNNLDHHHYVEGDTSQIIKDYTRQAVTQMLNEYPKLDGIGLTLGEGMGGMSPFERERWVRETIVAGMGDANRKSKLIHRIPFSGNTESLGATSVEMEQITRAGIEEEAAMDFIEKPVWASLKFNWSHAHSTTKLMKVHGGKIYGTYWDPYPEGYKMVWTARNEDFFCLRWGVADFVRAHIDENAHDYVGGYFVGSETYIPAKDYFTNPDIEVEWDYAFERQWLFYKLWGRLLYNSNTPDSVFRNEFIRRYGNENAKLFEASNLAGQTPLKLGSYFDVRWDFTLYSEGFMALIQEIPNFEYITVDRQINKPPLDSSYVPIPEYVKAMAENRSFRPDQITPVELAEELERDASEALKLVEDIDISGNTSLMFEVADIKAWANLGLYFAEKLRGGIALHTYRTYGDEANKSAAIQHLEQSLAYWDEVVAITRPIYQDMPLVHLSEQMGKPWTENDHLRFHWALIRDEVANDVEIARKATFNDL